MLAAVLITDRREGWQGIIKEMRVVLHPQVDNYDELNDSICKAIDYYINEDP